MDTSEAQPAQPPCLVSCTEKGRLTLSYQSWGFSRHGCHQGGVLGSLCPIGQAAPVLGSQAPVPEEARLLKGQFTSTDWLSILRMRVACPRRALGTLLRSGHSVSWTSFCSSLLSVCLVMLYLLPLPVAWPPAEAQHSRSLDCRRDAPPSFRLRPWPRNPRRDCIPAPGPLGPLCSAQRTGHWGQAIYTGMGSAGS